MKHVTTLHRANDSSASLRTTVPISFIKWFNLGENDKISWNFRIDNNRMIVEVEPVKDEGVV